MQNWKKIGRIYTPNSRLIWNKTHSMVPTSLYLGGDNYRIYISGRDHKNRSLIGYFDIDVTNPNRILEVSEEPILKLGKLGSFDDNGVTPASIIQYNNKLYLYYIGWKPRSTTRMSIIAGLAVSQDNGCSFKRQSKAPLLHLTDREPYSILTAPWVIRNKDIWQMWYVSGEGWLNPDLPLYNIKYATSRDGINWNRDGLIALDFDSENEMALARPCVIYEDGIYKMWFSYKTKFQTYRMGYAESKTGYDFKRKTELLKGLEPSSKGWDSEMIEYPCVFTHKNKKYMLYNGNNYGSNGVGIAIMKV
ncbi:MAG: hypothetical protein GY760_09045 [Deltaproteobacteria bacterium]|nr:hypothetical protein [Deltaproteobacteria bacterium]